MKPLPTSPSVEAPILTPERQVIWNAANIMACRGKSGPGESWLGPKVCAVVAISIADANAHDMLFRMKCWDLVEDHVGVERGTLTRWSDSSDQATVISAMRQAALTGEP
jgi:hypothetical protein